MSSDQREEILETFRKAYPSVRVNVWNDMLVYTVNDFAAPGACKDANALIGKLGLPLIATWHAGFPGIMNIEFINE